MEKKLASILRMVDRQKRKLLLANWTFSIRISAAQEMDDSRKFLASISISPEYHEAAITLFPAFWKEKDKELIIRHELCHCIVDPLFRLGIALYEGKLVTPDTLSEANEQITSHIEMLMRNK